MSPQEHKNLHRERVQKELENIKQRQEKALPKLDMAIEDINRTLSYKPYSQPPITIILNSDYLFLDDYVAVAELAKLLKKYLESEGWFVVLKSKYGDQYLILYPDTLWNRFKYLISN